MLFGMILRARFMVLVIDVIYLFTLADLSLMLLHVGVLGEFLTL